MEKGQSIELSQVSLDRTSCLWLPPFSHLFSDIKDANSPAALACTLRTERGNVVEKTLES